MTTPPNNSRDNADTNNSIKNNNTPHTTADERAAIESMGKIAFTRFHISFYKRMCRVCKARATTIILKEKARMDYDKLCKTCQRIYDGMVKRYIN